MLANIESEIPEVHRQVKVLCAAHGETETDEALTIAGYSSARGPESYSISLSENPSILTVAEDRPEVAAFSLTHLRKRIEAELMPDDAAVIVQLRLAAPPSASATRADRKHRSAASGRGRGDS
jgi:hypothetical protein